MRLKGGRKVERRLKGGSSSRLEWVLSCEFRLDTLRAAMTMQECVGPTRLRDASRLEIWLQVMIS